METESISKRAKMYNSHGDLETNTQKQVNLVSDFKEIVDTSAFVDKTLLIESMLGIGCEGILITAPRRFGKSVNLSMLKCFFEIEDKMPKLKEDWEGPVTDTSNYELFMKHGLNITKNENIMRQHFGKYPVIHVDFKCDTDIASYEDAIDICRDIVQNSFKQHKYLIKSGELNASQKSYCEKWCDDSSYLNFDKRTIRIGLVILSEYLYNHFNKKCFVLIDEYDSIITHVMLSTTNKRSADLLTRIVKFNIGILSALLKSNTHVQRGFITGISYIAGIGLSDGLNNIKTYKFLKAHNFVKFYGLTRDEVETLFGNPIFGLDPKLVEEAHENYNGYTSESGVKIYSLWSVLNFIQAKKVENYWKSSGTVQKLHNSFKNQSINDELQNLLRGESTEVTEIRYEIDHLLELRQLAISGDYNEFHNNVFFTFLWDQGYLTCLPTTESDGGKTRLRLPNEEIKSEFRSRLNNYYFEWINKFDGATTRKFIILLKEFYLAIDKYEQQVNEFSKMLGSLWKIFLNDITTLNETAMQAILFSLICNTKYYKYGIEQYCGNGRSDIVLEKYEETMKGEKKTLFSIIIELKFKVSSIAGLEQIIRKRNYKQFKHTNKCLLMGINMTEDIEVTTSYLIINPNAEDIYITDAKHTNT